MRPSACRFDMAAGNGIDVGLIAVPDLNPVSAIEKHNYSRLGERVKSAWLTLISCTMIKSAPLIILASSP